ncbi:hypothetical protein [Herbidospora sp. NBRC 101105]|uniref:hypothetical protein n=1 Tax=Herbidospora sp. NBRC 101105 TaxID=3032195 RepID=UPI0024A19419|nr:hypothetical protein [Herbidospora sp. NBRC 101105]GLX96652.1 hypothetical protein Hesp01_46020 [Herbidospora sp. NBRC 101105]
MHGPSEGAAARGETPDLAALPRNATTENGTAENRTAENRTAENRTSENRTSENRTSEIRTALASGGVADTSHRARPVARRPVRDAGSRRARIHRIVWVLLTAVLTGVFGLPGSALAAPQGQVVIIGVPGLEWADLSPSRTPNLWKLAETAGAASLSTRAVPLEGRGITCPVAGWLTVSAGQRAASPGCEPPVQPRGATVPDWQALVELQRQSSFQARIGALGQAVKDAGGKTVAVGPGALLAAADLAGNTTSYFESITDLDPGGYQLIVAEAPEISDAWLADGMSSRGREQAVAAADTTVGAILAKIPQGATILVGGVSDARAGAHLHVAMASGPSFGTGLLTASSTRQAGLVTITDLTATALTALGLPVPDGVVGRAWTATTQPADPQALADDDLASQVLRDVREPFFFALVMIQVLFYAVASVIMRRQVAAAGRAMMIVGVVSGAVPISTFLAQLVPWWSVAHPMPALVGTILGFALLIAAVAFAGPWRRDVLGPLGVVAGVSSVALLLDVMTGSHLQVNAVTGYEPVTGGRFYGFGNMAFAVYSTGTILFLAAAAHFIRRRTAALVFCAGYGVFAIAADGWPSWGADFGGVPSFVLGFAVFMLLLAGLRVSVARLALIAVGGAALITVIALADYSRPAEQRTHLGAFVQQVIDGEAGGVLARKLSAMLGTLGNWPLTLLSLVAVAFLFLVLARPREMRVAALSVAYEKAPELRAGLIGALTAAFVGFLINDSGIAIPAMALTVAVPLTLAAAVRAETPPLRAGATERPET